MNKISMLSLLLLFAASFVLPIFASENYDENLFLETDKEKYDIGEKLKISGYIKEKKMPEVALRIYDPDGTILSANNVEIENDNKFFKIISLDSPFYDKIGSYTITVEYGLLSNEIIFEMVNSEENLDIPPILEEPESQIIEMNTSKKIYHDGEFIEIIGKVSIKNSPSILIGIHDPFDFPTGFYFSPIDENNEFNVKFLAKSGVNFRIEGTYSAVAHYDDEKNTVYFNFEEFGKSEPEEKEIEPEEKEIEPEEKEIEPEEKEIEPEEKEIEPEEKLIKHDNLSVNDVRLEKMLNQIKSNCDNNEFAYSISYDDGMGSALVRLCKYDEAIQYYDQMLISSPNNVDGLNDKGVALSNLELFNEAIFHYDSALSINSKYVPSLNNKANTLVQLSNFKEALILYEKGLLIEPKNDILFYNYELAKIKYDESVLNQNILKSKSIPSNRNAETDDVNNSRTLGFFDNIFASFENIFSFFS